MRPTPIRIDATLADERIAPAPAPSQRCEQTTHQVASVAGASADEFTAKQNLDRAPAAQIYLEEKSCITLQICDTCLQPPRSPHLQGFWWWIGIKTTTEQLWVAVDQQVVD